MGQGRSTSTLHYANLQSNFLRSLSKESSVLNSLIFESPFQSLDRFIKHTERDAQEGGARARSVCRHAMSCSSNGEDGCVTTQTMATARVNSLESPR